MDFETMLRQMSNENTARTFDFNASEAQKARDYQTFMSNTSHQREVNDLKKAGLNPVLSTNGGAQAYSASSASGTSDNSAVGLLASIYQTKLNNQNAVKIAKMQNNNASAMKNKDLEIARINAQATKYASDNSYSASRYASDVGAGNVRYSSDTSYKGTQYSSDRTKYGMIHDFASGATNYNSALSLGKKTNSIGQRIYNSAKKWIKKHF